MVDGVRGVGVSSILSRADVDGDPESRAGTCELLRLNMEKDDRVVRDDTGGLLGVVGDFIEEDEESGRVAAGLSAGFPVPDVEVGDFEMSIGRGLVVLLLRPPA